MQVTFATGPSALARWQTARVIQLIQAAHPGFARNEYVMPWEGDRDLDHPFPEIGGRKNFTAELGEALLTGTAHAVVHSLKDLPSEGTPGLVLAAVPERGSAYDVLVSAEAWTLASLPHGARVGTSSLRRAAQLLTRRPDLTILPLRGDIDACVQKVVHGEYDAIVLAEAGLARLGLRAHIREVFSLEVMLPAPGQGALAVQCRADDPEMLALLAAIHDPVTMEAVQAERAFLAGLGNCSLPIGAFAEKTDGTIILTGAVISPDGKQSIRLSAVDSEPNRLGERLADLVLERGAAELLKASV